LYFDQINPFIAFIFSLPHFSVAFSGFPYVTFLHRHNVFQYFSPPSFSFPLLPFIPSNSIIAIMFYIYIHSYICIHAYTYMHIYIHTHIYILRYMHTYTHMHIHTHMYIYILGSFKKYPMRVRYGG
jgi:hypothetical protein